MVTTMKGSRGLAESSTCISHFEKKSNGHSISILIRGTKAEFICSRAGDDKNKDSLKNIRGLF